MHHLKAYAKKLWKKIVLAFLGFILIVGLVLSIPWDTAAPAAQPQPVRSYTSAMERIGLLQAEESNLNPLCRALVMAHGQKTARVIVFMHGFTNCPEQFRELGQRFYNLGYNVLILPAPHHGLANRLTDEQQQLTEGDVVNWTNQSADIAAGLGDHTTMAGISMGGVATAWAAQHRGDIDQAVLIAPAFGFLRIPAPFTTAIANLLVFSPNSFQWWDPALQDKPGPEYAYPRFSTQALGRFTTLGLSIQAEARHTAPAAHSILVITNAHDPAVNNDLTAQLAQNWQSHGARLTTYTFAAELGLSHDVIDPHSKDSNFALVYPRLIELIDQ